MSFNFSEWFLDFIGCQGSNNFNFAENLEEQEQLLMIRNEDQHRPPKEEEVVQQPIKNAALVNPHQQPKTTAFKSSPDHPKIRYRELKMLLCKPRDYCAKYFTCPFFAPLIEHNFVRVCVGPQRQYDLYQVLGVIPQYTAEPYIFNGVSTKCGLMTFDGKNKRPVALNEISNTYVKEPEFQRWCESMASARVGHKMSSAFAMEIHKKTRNLEKCYSIVHGPDAKRFNVFMKSKRNVIRVLKFEH